jgi:hypothetical protein
MIIKRSFCAGISGAPRAGRQRPPEHTGPRAGHAPQEGGGEDPPGVERAARPGKGGWARAARDAS